MEGKLTKAELIELAKKICEPDLPDELGSKYIDILEANVPHPAPSDIIFWDFRDLTPEEIVEIALNYKEEK
ncbi:bacteriocin immunity protein [Bacillus cereus]|uniref:bacteriocin immunity protein n=1 Tax=Bacillus TaxID=1386 RepID=UPI00054F99D2|nr:bacteriocin immunity protein [Bacillus sp. UNC322MFChir4.1]